MTSNGVPSLRKRTSYLLALFAVCILSFFWKLGYNGVFDLDEALYANCAREMALNGDFITPHINGIPFYEKPPLVYWMASLNYRLLGRNSCTTRLPSALLSLLMVWILYYFGRSYFDERTGLMTGLIYALNPLIVGEAHQLTTDATVTFCIACSLLCFYHSVHTNGIAKWYYGFWIFSALGVLAKGAPGIVFPVFIALLYLYFIKKRKFGRVLSEINRPRLYLGFSLFLVIAAPWHIAALLLDGRPFWEMYIIKQHLGRFYGMDTAHRAPFWFYVPSLLVGFMPWSFHLGQAYFRKESTTDDTNKRDFRLYLRIWIAVIFIVFSLSGSKLVSYILPLYPAAALLTADFLVRSLESDQFHLPILIGAICSFLFSIALFLPMAFIHPILTMVNHHMSRPITLASVPPEVFPWIDHLTLALTIGSGIALLSILFRNQKLFLFSTLAGITLFIALALGEGLPIIKNDIQRPLFSLVRKVDSLHHRPSNILIATGTPRRPSILFYLPDRYFQNPQTLQYHVVEMEQMHSAINYVTTHRDVVVLTTAKRALLFIQLDHLHQITANLYWSLLRQ